MTVQRIFKIELPQHSCEFERGLPFGSVFCAMHQQGLSMMSWWSCPVTDGDQMALHLRVSYTGEQWDDEKWFHLDSCCMADGDVWHLLARRDDGQED